MASAFMLDDGPCRGRFFPYGSLFFIRAHTLSALAGPLPGIIHGPSDGHGGLSAVAQDPERVFDHALTRKIRTVRRSDAFVGQCRPGDRVFNIIGAAEDDLSCLVRGVESAGPEISLEKSVEAFEEDLICPGFWGLLAGNGRRYGLGGHCLCGQ